MYNNTYYLNFNINVSMEKEAEKTEEDLKNFVEEISHFLKN